MVPKDLLQAADREGLVVEERDFGHFQIKGGILLVNYYPYSRRRSAYIEGMVKAHHHVTPEEAVRMALRPKPIPTQQERRRTYIKIKSKLYRISDQCYQCKQPILVFKDATLEHKVPLSQGGLDNENNMALSHEKCNKDAGNKMPEGRK
jgi:5-methylcytosine-specific restriction endonuclease McrA